MKVIAVNGSPRKKWNTATMLENALNGASQEGAETELVHLYNLDFKGCVSCFACKEKGGKSYGRCVVRDDLSEVFENIRKADALILGSPIYLGDVSGEMRSFMERLLFPYLVYEENAESLFPKKIPTAFVYTMNFPEEMAPKMGYEQMFKANEWLLEWLLGPCESLMSYDTLQFEDYSRYAAGRFDAAAKRKRHEEVFPEDCRKAFELGARMAR